MKKKISLFFSLLFVSFVACFFPLIETETLAEANAEDFVWTVTARDAVNTSMTLSVEAPQSNEGNYQVITESYLATSEDANETNCYPLSFSQEREQRLNLKIKPDHFTKISLRNMNQDTVKEMLLEPILPETPVPVVSRGISIQPFLNENAVPGDSIVLSTVFRAPVFTQGSGATFLNGGKILQITKAQNSQNGAIWSKDQLDLTKDFALKAYIYLGSSGTNAADGITFTLHNDERMGAAQENRVVGSPGMGIGAYSTRAGQPYVHYAQSIEFDTFYNSGSSNRMDREIDGNSNRGHVAFVTPKANNNNYNGEHSGIVLPSVPLSNDTWRTLNISWTAATKTLSYNLEGVGGSSKVIANLNTTFNGTKVYWGFTGSTGSKNADNRIAITQLPGSIDQQAVIENETVETSQQESVSGRKDDIVKITDTITMDGTSIMNSDQVKVTIQLPVGLTYEPGSLLFEGASIPAGNVAVNGNQLIISNLGFSSADHPYKVSLKAKVTSETPGENLQANFKVINSANEELSVSNKVTVTIPKVGKVIVHYVNEANTDLADVETITGEVGENFSVEPKLIDNYTYDSTLGSASGTFTETEQHVYFVYKLNSATITVKFVDESNSQLHDSVTVTGNIGSTGNLAENLEVQAAIAAVLADRYDLPNSGKPNNETSIPIVAGGSTVTYTFSGILTIDYLPAEIDFKVHEINTHDIREDQPDYNGNFVIWDNRKVKSQWNLKAQLSKPLTHATDPSKVIQNAIRYKKEADSPNEFLLTNSATEIKSDINSATQYNLTTQWRNTDTGFRLEVPAGSVAGPGKYQAEITWTLSAEPLMEP